VNDVWPEQFGKLATNTALLYDEDFKNVEKWGYAALAKKPKKSKGKSKEQPVLKPIENFKLHLFNMLEEERPFLPEGLSYEKVITDYLREMGKFNDFFFFFVFFFFKKIQLC
jgi:hypothetical protein